MSSGSVLQILANLIFIAGFIVVWIRLNKPAKDDPRLSRGLQLLQSKIAILEDLSDQVERQVQQVAQLMEVKGKDLQAQIARADDEMRRIETATARSLEVARIFQDRIPHEEIIDRKATLKYIKAARLANQGVSIDEISEQVDLSRGELEIIAKVNREQLQFSTEDLPEWALRELDLGADVAPAEQTPRMEGLEKVAAVPVHETLVESQPLMRIQDRTVEPLSDLGKRFREAFDAGQVPTEAGRLVGASAEGGRLMGGEGAVTELVRAGGIVADKAKASASAAVYPKTSRETATAKVDRIAEQAADKLFGPVVKKVVFPKIDL
ncbi:MAG: DUF2802 domain-containing protein [Bdellovibrionaceae bacterium]|nr:DUF2802 domain-containing protein [Pseudobdellovibrionaceae bacterium]